MAPRAKRPRVDVQSYSDSDGDSDTDSNNDNVTKHIHQDIRSTKKGINTSSSTTAVTRSRATAGVSSRIPAGLPKGTPVMNNHFENMNDMPMTEDHHANNRKILRPKRVRPKGDPVLAQWEERLDDFIHEFIGHEGRGYWHDNSCSMCGCGSERLGSQVAQYECVDCRDRELFCERCIVKVHGKLYLHRIRKWNGGFFEKSSLQNLGLRLQLGHRHGIPCDRPEKSFKDEFWIICSNGLHNISLDFCGCAGSPQHYVQLLRAGLFPSTVLQPQTAATFEVLDLFELLTFESKISAFEFYSSLVRLTCNDNLVMPSDRYASFVRMVHEYRHLHMVVRAGRGHDASGVSNTAEGECAVLCPACPQVGINMDPNWENSSKPYIHACFLALDANFRLKRKAVSSEELDPGFSKGWAYFVENTKYQQHWSLHAKEKEPKSSCSRHDAVNLSNTKGTFGHSASGVGKVCCSRHNMTLPNAIGDLQVGERYCNIDYLFYKATTTRSPVTNYVISYDIACQWSIHLQERMSRLNNSYFMFDGSRKYRFLVPKFHLPAHIAACRTRYSFNYSYGVGRTDGEAPERGWNETNPLAGSTREMGPGSRRDTINDHIGDHNWRKLVSMDESLRRKLYTAALDMAEHEIEFQDISEMIPSETRQLWTAQMDKFESDPRNVTNPFDDVDEGPTMAAIRRELAEEEAKRLSEGRDFALHDEVTQSVYIDLGIKLEAEQRAIKKESKEVWDHAQDRQRTKLQLNLNTLQRKIDSWLEFQRLYCPGVERFRKQHFELKDSSLLTEIRSCDFPLYLPSHINNIIPIDAELISTESRLRTGQAYESLSRLRRELQTRAYLYNFTDQHTRGQGASTRAKNTIDAANARINAAAEDYRVAFSALQNLRTTSDITKNDESNLGKWEGKLQPLQKEDVRHISQAAAGETIGNQTISWIWKVQTTDLTDADRSNPNHIKPEWWKCRARARRFAEEVDILTEEQNRTKRYFQSLSSFWLQLANTTESRFPTLSPAQLEAHQAYGMKKSAMFGKMVAKCDHTWSALPAHVARMRSIMANPSLAAPGEFAKSSSSKAKKKALRKLGDVAKDSDVSEDEEE